MRVQLVVVMEVFVVVNSGGGIRVDGEVGVLTVLSQKK